jgi:hypothetical protein
MAIFNKDCKRMATIRTLCFCELRMLSRVRFLEGTYLISECESTNHILNARVRMGGYYLFQSHFSFELTDTVFFNIQKNKSTYLVLQCSMVEQIKTYPFLLGRFLYYQTHENRDILFPTNVNVCLLSAVVQFPKMMQKLKNYSKARAAANAVASTEPNASGGASDVAHRRRGSRRSSGLLLNRGAEIDLLHQHATPAMGGSADLLARTGTLKRWPNVDLGMPKMEMSQSPSAKRIQSSDSPGLATPVTVLQLDRIKCDQEALATKLRDISAILESMDANHDIATNRTTL